MRTDIYSDTAFRLINSGKSLFVTGKAGTGKTTLLKKVYDRAVINKKNAIVLSPTGVAAKNAQGVTIHSFCIFHFLLIFLDMRIQNYIS